MTVTVVFQAQNRSGRKSEFAESCRGSPAPTMRQDVPDVFVREARAPSLRVRDVFAPRLLELFAVVLVFFYERLFGLHSILDVVEIAEERASVDGQQRLDERLHDRVILTLEQALLPEQVLERTDAPGAVAHI